MMPVFLISCIGYLRVDQFVSFLMLSDLGSLALYLGYFHADPHPGNILATRAGELVYLDFGMMSEAPLSARLLATLSFIVLCIPESGLECEGGNDLYNTNHLIFLIEVTDVVVSKLSDLVRAPLILLYFLAGLVRSDFFVNRGLLRSSLAS